MGLFWPISRQTAIWTIRKKEAAGTRIRGCKRHYMGLNLGFFLKTDGYKGPNFPDTESDGFTGVFSGRQQEKAGAG